MKQDILNGGIAYQYIFHSVENYRRQPRSMAEEDQNYGLLQHADNEIIISTSGKINRYVTVGLELLEVRLTKLCCFATKL